MIYTLHAFRTTNLQMTSSDFSNDVITKDTLPPSRPYQIEDKLQFVTERSFVQSNVDTLFRTTARV